MKETINYYYNLDIDKLDEVDGKYHFVYNQTDYFFVFYNRTLEELNDIINISNSLKRKNINCHSIILNKDNSYLSKVKDSYYILLKVENLKEEYDIIDMNNLNKKLVINNINSKLYRNNWPLLWIKKIDYFEYQIRQLGHEKNVILQSFSYYIGLAENAISYANKTINSIKPTEKDLLVLANRRIFYPNIKLNYLNPLSFIIDLEVRNIAEYLKALFFSNDNINAIDELIIYLKLKKLSNYSYQMLYARLLYPSYYFDIYEDIMNKNIDQNELLKIIKKNKEYELFLKNAYLEISKYAKIEKIDWIINLH